MSDVDEALPGQDEPRRLGRRTRIVLGAGVAILAVIGLVAALRHGSEGHPRAALTPTVSVPTTGLGLSAVPVVSPCDETGSNLSCRVSIGVPVNVVTAVRAVFPGARVDGSYTVTGRDRRLYVRRLSIVDGTRAVTLAIGVATTTVDRYDVRRGTMVTVTRYETATRTDAQRLQVRIDVRDRDRRAGVDRARLSGLAHDPRLLAVL